MNNDKFPELTKILQACVPLMAPNADATETEKKMASMGVMTDKDTNKIVSMCKPGMPCKEFNKYIIDVSRSLLSCGVKETD